jgi:hypothetical protein
MDQRRIDHEGNRRRDAFTAAHWTSTGITVTIRPRPPGLRSVADAARRLFGRQLAPLEWAELVGAPDGALVDVVTVRADQAATSAGVLVRLSHPWLDGTALRVAYRDEAGRLAITNVFLAVRPDAPPGIATRLLALEVRKAAALGVEYLTLDAAGGPGSPFVGYAVWPRLGFTGPIPDAVRRKLAALPAGHPLRSARDVVDLVSRPGGRAWWRANGTEFRAFFDLSDGSASREVLRAYTQEKGIVE